MPNTPIGTRIWPTRMPLGCCCMPTIWPMMSGMAASCSQPWAQVSSTCGVRRRRSTIGADKPASWARCTSWALCAAKASPWVRSKRASARSAWFLRAAGALAIKAAAAWACTPRVCIKSTVERVFMCGFSPRTPPPGTSCAYRRPTLGHRPGQRHFQPRQNGLKDHT